MASKTQPVTEMTYADLANVFTPASYYFGRTWCPAVDAGGDGYQIRVVKNDTRTGSSQTTSYDYFRLDSTGLVVESPRGYAKDYTKRVRVVDIAEVAKAQEAPDPNGRRISLGF
jgi:hypothetical protein